MDNLDLFTSLILLILFKSIKIKSQRTKPINPSFVSLCNAVLCSTATCPDIHLLFQFCSLFRFFFIYSYSELIHVVMEVMKWNAGIEWVISYFDPPLLLPRLFFSSLPLFSSYLLYFESFSYSTNELVIKLWGGHDNKQNRTRLD